MAISANNSIRLATTADLPRVLELHKTHREWLGHLPDEPFERAVDDEVLLVAENEVGLVGYLLYARVQRSYDVRVVHLAVKGDLKGRGIGKELVSALAQKESDRWKIRLRCVSDFPAALFWKQIGFIPVHEAPGRSRSGRPLTDFEFVLNPQGTLQGDCATYGSRTRCVVDLNIVLDLMGDRRNTAYEIDRLDDLGVQLCSSGALQREISELKDSKERDAARRIIQPWVELDRNATTSEFEELKRVHPVIEDKDLSYLADAAANEVEVVLTGDTQFVDEMSRSTVRTRKVMVMEPSVYVHEQRWISEPDVWKRDLSEFRIRRKGFDMTRHVDQFVSNSAGERKRDLRASIDSILSNDEYVLEFLTISGEPHALWAYRRGTTGVTSPLLRVCRGQGSEAIAGNVLSHLRETAIELLARQIATVNITDPFMSRTVVGPARRTGFRDTGSGLMGISIAGVLPVAHACDLLVDFCQSNEGLSDFADAATAVRAAEHDARTAIEAERQFEPLTLVGTDIPAWLVPIRAKFADDLIGAGDQGSLLGRAGGIATRRDHVYFRADDGKRFGLPARIFWYRSSERKTIYATSILAKTVAGPADRIWKEFQNFGIFDEQMVRRVAHKKSGRVMAMRFTQTRIFDRPVPLSLLNEVREVRHQCEIHPPPTTVSLTQRDADWLLRIGLKR